MYRARNYLTKNSLRKLYFAYIYPYLIYCIEIWGISPQTHLKPLLLWQKKLVRIMTFSTYYAHTDPLFKDIEILIIDRLVIHRIGILMYKLNSGQLPKVLCNFFTGMRFFRNFQDLRGHSRGNRRSDLIFMGGGGGYHIFCVLAERQQCWNGTP